MKKTQIRLMLDKEGIKISSTRIGEVATSLGFGNHVDYTYTDLEAKQILEVFRQDAIKPQTADAATSQPVEPLPPEDSRALTKQVIGQSTNTLISQVKDLATRMDASDRTLARQLAQYVVDRPQRFTVMFAQELSALMSPAQESPQSFVDADLVDVEMPDLTTDFLHIAPATALGALPM